MSQPNILHNFKSKNFDSRKYKIQFIVLHYTETKNLEKAIDLLTSKKRKVSCHFVVDTDGQIYNLVSESKRAWHAGESSWKGLQDMNSRSIGIEIVNPGEKKLKNYPKVQINQLINLIHFLEEKFNIPFYNILGHSDIAPHRKIDPGKHFPWKELHKKKIGLWVEINQIITRSLSEKESNEFLQNLYKIGYQYPKQNNLKTNSEMIINAFHRHFVPKLVGKKPTSISLIKSRELIKINKT